MKKSILTLALALISAVTIAQNNLTPGQNGKIPDSAKHVSGAKVIKPLSAVKKDTVKADLILHFDIEKKTAVAMLPGLIASYMGVTRAKNITAEQADDAKQTSEYIIRLIYQKWPDLAPRQPSEADRF